MSLLSHGAWKLKGIVVAKWYDYIKHCLVVTGVEYATHIVVVQPSLSRFDITGYH